MSDDVEAQLGASRRREAALAGVLSAVARGGELPTLLHEIADRVDAMPMGDVEFKGLSRPVPIHEITALR